MTTVCPFLWMTLGQETLAAQKAFRMPAHLHAQCLGELCAIWDSISGRCSILAVAQRLSERKEDHGD